MPDQNTQQKLPVTFNRERKTFYDKTTEVSISPVHQKILEGKQYEKANHSQENTKNKNPKPANQKMGETPTIQNKIRNQ